MDQASTLRMMTRDAGGVGGMQIYSVTSGKGGVGKTSLVCNIAHRFGQLGRKVLLVDADMGLANVDIVMGLKPKATLAQLFSGECSLEDLLVEGPPNVTVLPSASGVQELSHLSDEQVLHLMSALDDLDRTFDVLLIDTGAGIGKNVLYFNAAAREVLVVATPQPTSLTDAYAMIKVMRHQHDIKRFQLIVNQVASRKEALRVYRHLTTVADEYLDDVALDYLGHVVSDPAVGQAVVERQLLMDAHPDNPAALCIAGIVDRLDDEAAARPPSGNLQFFWRRLLQPSA